ncbi:MAG: glycosyltransferase family 2 protein [Ginsengibacter sp.]
MNLLSVLIITLNEEKNIARCIDSVKRVADEVILLDCYSDDNTVSIARKKGAVIYQQKFEGYIEQKNCVLQLASYDFVLSLDADEAIDETLERSILKEKENFTYSAYRMNRCNNYCGRFIRHGLWYPDKKIRLFDKRLAKWGGLNPHDKIQLANNCTVKHLPGDILHFSHSSIEEHIQQNNKLSSIAAHSLYKIGKRGHWTKLVINPGWAFFKGYFLRLGFLDGFYGFMIAINTSHQTFLKYIKLYYLQRAENKKPVSAVTSTIKRISKNPHQKIS